MEHVKIEYGKYGRRAVVTSIWSPEIERRLIDDGIDELELNQGKGWRGKDLFFLSRFPNLKCFEIFDFNISNISPVHFLHDLLALRITTYCDTVIDFRKFPNLKECSLEWRKGSESIFDCVGLAKLFLNRYSGVNTDSFIQLSNLESLAILNSPIRNLHGLSGLLLLKSLRLGNLRKLDSLDGIQSLSKLEELEVHACRRISSISPVAHLKELRKLNLNNDGEIDSLKPLNCIDSLELVVFSESTNIVDGDIRPLLRQNNLSRVSYKNRKHYSNRREEFPPTSSRD